MASLPLALLTTAQALSFPATRAERWAAVRVAKSEHVEPERLSAAERALLSIEQAVEGSWLVTPVLGLPVYGWLLVLLAVALVFWTVRALRRRGGGRQPRLAAALAATALMLLVPLPQAEPSVEPAPRFLPGDPLLIDPDTLSFPSPAALERSELLDVLANSFTRVGQYEGPALNVNTLGEVPNSSWYTNRHGQRRLPMEALVRGPNRLDGPDTSAVWKVVSLKREGKSAGMHVVDARGDRYVLKFDPPGYPELATGAEAVSTKLLYALGYQVPENYLVRFEREQLWPDTAAGIRAAAIEAVLAKAAAPSGGGYRALASRFLEGDPLGPILYAGTRGDDPNDIFPHEARRELRGLRVFGAWINHYDARRHNTLAVFREASDVGAGHVRHCLIDFGTTLGGSPIGPQRRWAGHEYLVDVSSTIRRRLSLGLYDAPWERITYPDVAAVGRFEADHFDPARWVPQYPNPAFERMDAADAFWAARQVMRFTDAEIRAIVASAYTDEEAARIIADTLIRRRDAIGAAYLGFGGGLDGFAVRDGALCFDDLPLRYGLAPPRPRRVVWAPFSNAVGQIGPPLAEATTTAACLPIPEADALFLTVTVAMPSYGRTRAYLERTADGYRVVGVERCGEGEACEPMARRQALRADLFARYTGGAPGS